jgi:hypothetical protein
MPIFVIAEFGGKYRAVIQEQNGDKEHRNILAARKCLWCTCTALLHTLLRYITDTKIIYKLIYVENQAKYTNVICSVFEILN